ncbi:MAG: PIN domain-containing protein [Chloroflexi bacterium]|nr:PIN domain-containing protein [Chloroflexota bacterium]
MSRIFVDTWAWYALADAQDRDHELAQLAVEDIIERKVELVTTNFVLDEATTLIRYKLGHPAALKFRATIRQLSQNELLSIYRISEAQELAAGDLFERYADQDLSFTDCTSFVVMQELDLNEAFTSDHHFRILGFTLVP